MITADIQTTVIKDLSHYKNDPCFQSIFGVGDGPDSVPSIISAVCIYFSAYLERTKTFNLCYTKPRNWKYIQNLSYGTVCIPFFDSPSVNPQNNEQPILDQLYFSSSKTKFDFVECLKQDPNLERILSQSQNYKCTDIPSIFSIATFLVDSLPSTHDTQFYNICFDNKYLLKIRNSQSPIFDKLSSKTTLSIDSLLNNPHYAKKTRKIYQETNIHIPDNILMPSFCKVDSSGIISKKYLLNRRPNGSSMHSPRDIYILNSVFVDSPSGLLINDEHIPILDVRYPLDKYRLAQYTPTSYSSVSYLPGCWLSVSPTNSAISHFFTEILKRVLFASSFLRFSVILPSSIPSHFIEYFHHLASSGVIVNYLLADAQTLYKPENSIYINDDPRDVTPHDYTRFRACFRCSTNSLNHKLYVTRRYDINSRRFLGEEEAEELAKKKGYAIIECQHLTLQEKIELFSNSSSIAGPVGAAHFYSLFAPDTINNIYITPNTMKWSDGHLLHISRPRTNVSWVFLKSLPSFFSSFDHYCNNQAPFTLNYDLLDQCL